MSQNTKENSRVQIFYAVHNDGAPHLHSYRTREEALAEIADPTSGVNSPVYTANEVLFALDEQPRLRAVAIAAAEISSLNHGSPVIEPLIGPLAALAGGVVVAFQAGRLDGIMDREKAQQMGDAIAGLKAMNKADEIRDRKIRVVASRPRGERGPITDLIGSNYEVHSANPFTDEVRIIAKGHGVDPITLSPDEYVFADELTEK